MTFETVLIFIASFTRVLGIMFLLPVLKIQYRETKIRDNVTFIRWGIFLCTVTYVLLSIAFITFNVGRLFNIFGNDIVNILSLSAGVANLTISIVIYMIYHKDYDKEVS